jgi:exonuclease III
MTPNVPGETIGRAPMRLGEEQYRVVCWNMAGRRSDEQWRFLLDDLDPDLALLQEVKRPPNWVAERGGALVRSETTPASGWGSAIYVREGPLEQIHLEQHDGYFVAARLQLPGARPGLALSVHGRTDKARPGGGTLLAPYMKRALDFVAPRLDDFRVECFVGGDFNLSREMDRAYGTKSDHPGHHGTFFDELAAQRDLVDCCRRFSTSEKRSLYRNGRAHPDYQLDHLFASREFARSLNSCEVLDWQLGGLSDHAPVLGVFAPNYVKSAFDNSENRITAGRN